MFKRFLRGNVNGSIQRTLNAMSDAVMIVDRNLTVTFANKAFETLVCHHTELFKAHFPHLNPAMIVGSRIDTLHPKLADQRILLAEPSNLPFVTDMTLGSMTLNISLTATYNAIGLCSGYVVQWRDVTAHWENEERMSAIDRSQGRIELGMDGKVITANQIFLDFLGYTLQEAVGQHHSSFVTADYAKSQDYKDFWAKLNRGEYIFGSIHRVGKGGKEVWLQAIYNPICDANGKPYKVVKYATDITKQYQTTQALEIAVHHSKQVIAAAHQGDLSQRIPLEGKVGEVASLCDGINALLESMTDLVMQVYEACETINTASQEISSGNVDLSNRTEEQASSLEETASSMEQIASTVKQSAENAQHAKQMAEAASTVAIQGSDMVCNVVSTMSAINQSSRKIEDIITVIDGIAFQTNILALNAAVEAARAGEQGRGFAVVAGEVRNLAQRSASAAKEIKGLINDSVRKTSEGTQLVEGAGKTMDEIVKSVQSVTKIMNAIADATIEQSAGIELVNVSIINIDEATQQNAALVEQAAAASESLVEQASQLMYSVNRYKIGGNSGSKALVTPNARLIKATASPHVQQSANMQSYKTASRTGTHDADWEAF